jgi:hypothetical protein
VRDSPDSSASSTLFALPVTDTRRRTMTRLSSILVLVVAVMAFAPVASAQQPGFDILVSPLETQLVRKVFTNQSGDVVKEVWTGVVKVRLTNLETGESIGANISGPEQIRVDEDGSVTDVAVGPWLITSRRAGAIYLTKGRFVFGSGPVAENLRGTFEDACVLLADA